MSNNYLSTGEMATVTAPYALTSGDGCLVGSLFGVAAGTYLINATDAEIKLTGKFALTKVSTETWTYGLKLYWDDSAKKVTSVSTAGMLIGTAAGVTVNPSTTGPVRLNGSTPSSAEGPQGAIVTLTDSTSLSGTHNDTLSATAALVTLTNSTGLTPDNTLAAPSVPVDITGGEAPTEAEHNAALAAMRIVSQNSADVGGKVMEIVTQLAVTNQNISDLGQKMIEVLAALVAAGVIAA